MDIVLLRIAALLAVAAAATQSGDRASGVATALAHVKRREIVLLDNTALESLRRGSPQYYIRRASRPRPYSAVKRKRRPIPKGRSQPKKKLRTLHKYSPHKKYEKHKYAKRRPQNSHRKPLPPKNRRPSRYHNARPPVPYVPQEPVGFGEPPADRYPTNTADRLPDSTTDRFPESAANRYPDNSFRQSYAEPPIDSYGNPLRTRFPNSFNQVGYIEYPSNYQHNFPPIDHEGRPSNVHAVYDEHSYESDSSQNIGSNFAEEHDIEISGSQRNPYRNANADDDDQILPPNDRPYQYTNSDNSGPGPAANKPSKYHPDEEEIQPTTNKHNPAYHSSHNTHRGQVSKPNRAARPARPNQSNEVIVGGQYAEPPGRYVPKFRSSTPLYGGNNPFVPGELEDNEESASSHHASYVNYKNSNMAFSPQNLNDAFSVTDFKH